MSDTMRVQPFEDLLRWILAEFRHRESIFGIPAALFYTPQPGSPYASEMFGHTLFTPVGPAAGPHTQLAQNIVCAWLSGGRFIELKTVQIMDELEIPRPCIDLADEGYNVEWSQELKLEQSAAEYVKAWALIHVLHRLLGFEGQVPVGTIFNMSVGYNLSGIQSPPMVRFMDRLADAAEEIAAIQDVLRARFPAFASVEIPVRISDNVTLSTMHGCPSDEIERIARYLLEERGLHTLVKLNPTLLGRQTVMHILHDALGFREIQIPDDVFAHDLSYEQAVALIMGLRQVAAARGRFFGVKLSNTLAMANHRGVLPASEMYMSGRALYPITLNLFRKLAHEFGGELAVSYSGGADALNVIDLLAAGARPVTAASDLLKPGGISRLRQYLETLENHMRARGVDSLEALAEDRLAALDRAASEALRDPRYKKSYHPYGLPKVDSALAQFDCIAAPCKAGCAVCQDVPEYAWLITGGEYGRALEMILSRNPLPGITGHVCTHLCQTRCTRNNYDEPVAIRALKRFAFEQASADIESPVPRVPGHHVAVIGSGPAGLSAAYFLALNGVKVTVFEARAVLGGMPAIAPEFRLPREVVRADVERIEVLGVRFELSHPITEPPERLLGQGYDAVYVACGFPRNARLGIDGEEAIGVVPALDLLEQVARSESPELGERVLVIGGGNTAMDAARTAARITGRPVTLVYRRTRDEMPASEEECQALLAEGNKVIELASPVRIALREGRVAALCCVRNKMGEPGPDGRPSPVPVPGSEFQIEADTIIVAIGQQPDVGILDGSSIQKRADGAIVAEEITARTSVAHVYAGGDAVRGPATIIEACADGRKAAAAICQELGIGFTAPAGHPANLSDADVLQVKQARARREAQHRAALLPPAERGRFDRVEATLTEEQAHAEALRCLQCATLCDKCVEVCPNRANVAYRVAPVRTSVPRLACRDGRLELAGEDVFQISQTRQIIHLDDFCNECGNCATFCVHHGDPYRDKPRLFLEESDFRRETDNAYYVEKSGGALWRREGGQEARLAVSTQTDEMTYETDQMCVVLGAMHGPAESKSLSVKKATLKKPFGGEVSLVPAAEMAVIWQGITDSLPFLLPAERAG